MRIFIITSSLPYPPASGGAIRVHGMIKELAQRGHHITLACFHDDTVPSTPLNDYCEQIITAPSPHRKQTERLKTLLLSQEADIERRLFSPLLWAKISQALTQMPYDIVQFEGIEMGCYLPLVRQYHPQLRCVFDTFNAEAQLQRVIASIDLNNPKRLPHAVYSYLQSRRIARYERSLCQQAHAVIAVSEEDATLLNAHVPEKTIHVVPSGIVFDQYAPAEKSALPEENVIVFTGKMDYRPNIDAVTWFVTRLLLRLPKTALVVVGQKPTPALLALSQSYPVTFTGWVDNIAPYLTHGTLYIAPLRMGSGTRLKLLEAMAHGCAIVATPLASAGISREVKNAIKVAHTDDAFLETIRTLLADSKARAELGTQAQQLVKLHYDWQVLVPKLISVYEGLFRG